MANEPVRRGRLLDVLVAVLVVPLVAFFALWGCGTRLGTPCWTGADCDSGYCVGAAAFSHAGVCCESSCSGPCERCAAPTGLCRPVTTEGSGCQGYCDGRDGAAFTFPGASVECRTASCDADAGLATLPGFCDGIGTCSPLQTQGCLPGVCEGDACAGACAADPTACTEDEFCSAGLCVAKLDAGSPCGTADQCESGFCVDGVCCDGPCGGQCEACVEGACSPVRGEPHAGRRPCDSECEGACDGVNRDACQPDPAGTICGRSCREAETEGSRTCTCRTGVRDECDGNGACWAPPEIRCGEGGAGGAGGSGGGDASSGSGGDDGSGGDGQGEGGSGGDVAAGTGLAVTSGSAAADGGDEAEGVELRGGGCDCSFVGRGPDADSAMASIVLLIAGWTFRRRRCRTRWSGS